MTSDTVRQDRITRIAADLTCALVCKFSDSPPEVLERLTDSVAELTIKIVDAIDEKQLDAPAASEHEVLRTAMKKAIRDLREGYPDMADDLDSLPGEVIDDLECALNEETSE